jgi:predicted Zn-dependent protease
MQIGAVYLVQSRTEDAILWLEKARGANPVAPLTQGYLASAYALKGEMGRAASALAEVRRLSGDGFYSSIARVKAARYFGVPKVSALYEATYIAGLRKAGMPED